jgi:hypothetical protein
VWDKSESLSYFREIDLLTLARVALLGGLGAAGADRLEWARALLEWLRDQALAAGRGAVVMEALALEAIAFGQAGADALAHERLDEALALAAPEGFLACLPTWERPWPSWSRRI